MGELTLSVTEIYESIQGETSLAGTMTSFVRLAGCPLRCRWCDSGFSLERGEEQSFSYVLDQIHRFGWRHVCVTGGEPLIQPAIYPFLDHLLADDHIISLETNGAISTEQVPRGVRIILDIKCPQSGMSDRNDWSNLSRLTPLDEVKFVLANRTDYDWAKNVITSYNLFAKAGHVLLSPVYRELDPSNLVAWMIQDRLAARLNLQLHKVVWSPTARGV